LSVDRRIGPPVLAGDETGPLADQARIASGPDRLDHAGSVRPEHAGKPDARVEPLPDPDVAAIEPAGVQPHHRLARGRYRVGQLDQLHLFGRPLPLATNSAHHSAPGVRTSRNAASRPATVGLSFSGSSAVDRKSTRLNSSHRT